MKKYKENTPSHNSDRQIETSNKNSIHEKLNKKKIPQETSNQMFFYNNNA